MNQSKMEKVCEHLYIKSCSNNIRQMFSIIADQTYTTVMRNVVCLFKRTVFLCCCDLFVDQINFYEQYTDIDVTQKDSQTFFPCNCMSGGTR